MKASRNEQGTSLVETMIAVLVALVGVFSLGGLLFQATVTNKNQGTELTRATIYAQDKMEKLLSMNMNPYPADPNGCNPPVGALPATCNTTGITAVGWTQGLLAGGDISTTQFTCPATGIWIGYVDYLDANGIQISGASCAAIAGVPVAYIRQWQITDISPNGTPSVGVPAIKQITVAVYAQAGVNSGAGKPIVVLTSILSNSN